VEGELLVRLCASQKERAEAVLEMKGGRTKH